MDFHCLQGDAKLGGDLFGGEAFFQRPDDLHLAVGEVVDIRIGLVSMEV